jgi:hypothetical protein
MKKLEIIPQHTYSYGDGIPAYKFGEWPGSKSSHFRGSKLILKPIPNPDKPFKLGHLVHFPQRYSKEYKFIPHRKKLYPILHEENKKPSKRYITPNFTAPKTYHRSINNRPPEQMNSELIAPLFQKKIRVKLPEKKEREWGLEVRMSRKKRIFSLNQQRNGMITTNLGDKNYKNVDNSPDFFKEGGLIVGSTNRINYNKSIKRGEDNFYQTLDLGVKILNDDKIWDIKLMKESMDLDKNYVKNLNQWEENNFENSDDKTKKNVK